MMSRIRFYSYKRILKHLNVVVKLKTLSFARCMHLNAYGAKK